MKNNKILLVLIVFGLSITNSFSQNLTAKEIVEKAYYNERRDAYGLDVSITLVRPSWSRELESSTWALDTKYGMMLISGPAKDKGVSFLRVGSEGWNWLPSIERIIKISPSQMTQSWMGSDFTNEDLLKEASIVNDYNHKILSEETFKGTVCYKIEAIPKQDAAVVWGKKIVWIGKEDLLERKTENYDEDNELISTLIKEDVKEIDGKKLPTTLTMTPNNKEGYRTIVKILSGKFKMDLTADFFNRTNMKRLK